MVKLYVDSFCVWKYLMASYDLFLQNKIKVYIYIVHNFYWKEREVKLKDERYREFS